MPRVFFGSRCNRTQVGGEPLAVDMPHEDFREGDRTIRTQGVRRAVQTESHLIQVALEFKAGGVDKALVLRVVRHFCLVEVGVGTQRPQVEIEDAVRFGQEPGGLGRGFSP